MWSNIFVERPYVKLFAIIWRKWSIVPLRHLPTRWMVSGSACTISKSMAPLARRERALMYALTNPIVGTAARMTDLLAAVILYPRICCHLLPPLIIEKGVLPLVPVRWRYGTHRRIAATVQPWVLPVLPWLINSPLTQFFYLVKRRLKKSACARILLVEVVALWGWFPINIWTSLSLKRW